MSPEEHYQRLQNMYGAAPVNAFYQPLLSNWQNYESWQEAGGHDATARATKLWKKALRPCLKKKKIARPRKKNKPLMQRL